MPATEKEALVALKRNMAEWGVDPNDKLHVQFRGIIVAIVLYCFRGKPLSSPTKGFANNNNPEKLPKESSLAIERVLTSTVQELSLHQCTLLHDMCNTRGGPPYLVHTQRNDPQKLTIPKKRDQFNSFRKYQLDPLGSRFSVIRYESKVEYFYEEWVVSSDEASKEGLVFEALVSSHAIHNEACFHCKFRGTLRWQGGPLAPWTDIVCMECESAFEIKTKRDMETIERGHERQFHGGSYSGFYDLHRQPRKQGWKHYVVMVSRTPSSSRMNEQHWVVQVAEIERILPKLTAKAFTRFLDGADHIPLGSYIVTAQEMKWWFNVPYQSLLESKPLFAKVLKQEFPRAFVKLQAKHTQQKVETTQKEKERTDQKPPFQLDTLKTSLEEDEVRDNWDDSSDDGED